MEDLKVREFISISYGVGSGYGDGSGDGYGSGYGYGYGDGSGDGSGYGVGYGNGSGSGSGSGYGDGSGDGSGSGYGYGYGYGDGSGDGFGKKSINGMKICTIDGIPTVLTSIKGNIAKGYILNGDLSLTPCYVVKTNNLFAHGKTLHEAQRALQGKLFRDMSEDERIKMFITEFPTLNTMVKNQELFDWHNKLTGSCLMGRKQFVKNNNISLEENMSVYDFIELTKDSYGGDVIKKLAEKYEEENNVRKYKKPNQGN
jgi:hypothetical protein